MLDYIEHQADELGKTALQNLSADRWPALQRDARRRLRRSLGLDPWPARGDLRARVIGTVDRGTYLIERVVIQPRPGFVVPALVYVPAHRTGPFPAVVYAVGHWMRHGKSERLVQASCAGLAQRGFVVLAMDPIGQGEREPRFEDHGHLALLPLGLAQEGLMAWEHMRAVDYLLTRPDVNGSRIGLTGASGGGLTTMFTTAIDERIGAAASVCFVTSYRRFLRVMRALDWNGVGDLCNQVPGVIADLEMSGVGGLIWPRPLLVINGIRDPQFPVAGAAEAVEWLAPLYKGRQPDALRMHVADADHGYDQSMREASYGWFSRWLRDEGDGAPLPELPWEPLPETSPSLRCFEDGPVSSSVAIHELIVTTAQRRGHGPTSTTTGGATPELVRRVLGVRDPGPGEGTLAGRVTSNGMLAERHMIVPEDGISVIAHLFEPSPAAPATVVLLVDDDEPVERRQASIEAALAGGSRAFVVEPRGTGEAAPRATAEVTLATLDGTLRTVTLPEAPILEFEIATDCLMLGRSLIGQQVQDVLAAARYLMRIRPAAPASLTLAGLGPLSSMRALFAAALEPAIGVVSLDGLPLSYASVVHGEPGPLRPTGYVFDVMRHFDLGDVLALLAGRTVTLSRTVDGRGRIMASQAVRAAYRVAASQFSRVGGELAILDSEPPSP